MAARVLVIGGTGLVGYALTEAWKRGGTPVVASTYHCRPARGFRQLDMQDARAVEQTLDETRPTLVALPAAQPHVDYIELHPEETRRINVEGTRNVAEACAKRRLPLIFFSSDYVFDGKKGVYDEADATSPINEYGRQKAESERVVLELSPSNLIVRTSGAYGWQFDPKNFVLSLRDRLLKGERVRVAADLRYNPTSADDLAGIVVALAARRAGGIFHVVGSERISRYAFANKVCEVFRLPASLVDPVPVAELKSPTPRPLETSLRVGKVHALLGIEPWGVDEGLRRMRATEAEWLGCFKNG
ncbi:MAG: SDR family oxidoreductase [Elusimicrobia bacterium]|nr:SDR family oxidoreductase [Elusimicrobiota bacterium]